jgi:cobaltochelatase CobN
MHLLRTTTRLIEEDGTAIDLGQSPAEFVFLSFSDSDLGLVSTMLESRAGGTGARLAPLGMLKHPYSVDLYVEKAAAKARFVLVRLLGGLDYWRYGAEELAVAARKRGFDLAIVPGDGNLDPRLDDMSTLPPETLHRIWRAFQEGGLANMARLFDWIDGRMRGEDAVVPDPAPVAAAGLFDAACRSGPDDAPLAAIVFYRAYFLSGDVAPIIACAEALSRRGARVQAIYVSSLKDKEAAAWLRDVLIRERPDVILNSTAFAARMDEDASPLEAADAPILQMIHAGAGRAAWQSDSRGLGAGDLAMHVVLPEIDGRIITRPISFKEEAARSESLEFTRLVHRADESRIGFVADLALGWAHLRRLPRATRKLACVISDYPAKAGRAGYAVGLDTPASLAEISALLAGAGYAVETVTDPGRFIRALAESPPAESMALAEYRTAFSSLPGAFQKMVIDAWGAPEADAACAESAFRFRALRLGRMVVAIQPDRARSATRKAAYHDGVLPPCHGYIAFYLWLRWAEAIDAMIQLGTHGTLEWLPGKAVALSDACAPEVLLGPVPLIYPFIVNNPGEAAQAKRRAAALIIGHLTPPLRQVESHGDLSDFEALFDEYAASQQMDPKRAALLARTIIAKATESGLAAECGIPEQCPAEDAIVRLDGWLCDIKDMRITDGLHVFGRQPNSGSDILTGTEADPAALARLDLCAERERAALLAALDGRFIEPGPAGAPARGRLDVLPTGRNLFTIDPRMVPTRTAWQIGRISADAVVARHLQDKGEWPQRIIIDLWGSATMRTGGEELAQVFAYLGAQPVWDQSSARITGFTILPPAAIEGPRIDVTLRLSGLFRDVFPTQIALIEQLIREISQLDEDAETNPLAAARAAGASPVRIFGAAPGSYGTPIGRMLATDAGVSREALGEAYLAASHYAQGSAGRVEESLFRDRVATADAFLHVQDVPGQDVLDSSAFAEHEGGFAAASELLGGKASLYHLDTSRAKNPVVHSLAEEVARVVRGRAANPVWIEGQMRHGHRGGAEIAETVDNLYAFAVTSNVVTSRQFELVFDATIGNEIVLAFLEQANPEAARAIAERFDHAMKRGLFSSRRNLVADRLAKLLEPVR